MLTLLWVAVGISAASALVVLAVTIADVEDRRRVPNRIQNAFLNASLGPFPITEDAMLMTEVDCQPAWNEACLSGAMIAPGEQLSAA